MKSWRLKLKGGKIGAMLFEKENAWRSWGGPLAAEVEIVLFISGMNPCPVICILLLIHSV